MTQPMLGYQAPQFGNQALTRLGMQPQTKQPQGAVAPNPLNALGAPAPTSTQQPAMSQASSGLSDNFQNPTSASTSTPPAPGSVLVNPGNGTLPYWRVPGGGEQDVGAGNQTVGIYNGIGSAGKQFQQQQSQQYSIANTPDYQQYAQLGTAAQGFGLQAGGQLNSPGVTSALGQQASLAQAPSGMQETAYRNTDRAVDLLGSAAAGNGPTAAGAQFQQNLDASIRAQQAQANSARGNGQANAALQAQQTGASMQGQAAAQSAQLRAQEQQAAQSNFAQAAAAQGANANQAQAGQVNAANLAATNAMQNQNTNENYYLGQQQALQEQQQMAANMGIAQVNADYGLAGTQLQTQAQQNIAQGQQNAQTTGAIIGAVGAGIAAFA